MKRCWWGFKALQGWPSSCWHGWESPAQLFPHPKEDLIWKCKGSWDYLRSSTAPSPGGVGKPRRCQPWAPALEKVIPGCVFQSWWHWEDAAPAHHSSEGFQTASENRRGKKPHQHKRKMTGGERQGIAAARVVKSLDKIFKAEEQKMLSKC